MKLSLTVAHPLRLLLPGSLLLLGACQSERANMPPPPPEGRHAEITNEFTAKAEVAAIVPAERAVTLRREDGSLFEVQVDQAVRNFEQLAVGDTVRVQYKERLRALQLPPGTSTRSPQAGLMAARAPAGAKPGAGLGVAVSLRVRIESLDVERGIVVFSLDSGELIARRLRTSEGREFAAALSVGDTVQLDYAESLALGVEKL